MKRILIFKIYNCYYNNNINNDIKIYDNNKTYNSNKKKKKDNVIDINNISYFVTCKSILCFLELWIKKSDEQITKVNF